jgi:hypothetical protein
MFSRHEFQKAVLETNSEYHSRGFKSWNHFVALLFGQLAGQDSLRGIEAGLASQVKHLYHLGVRSVHRSTLSYANEHRSHELFKKVFEHMLSKCKPIAPKHKFKFKNPLYSIDTTLIQLCLSLHNWARFCNTKGEVKLHVKLSHSGYLPTFLVITAGNVADQKIAFSIPMQRGDIVVFDKGYADTRWHKILDDKGVYFVTRLRKNASYEIIKRVSTKRFPNIRSEHIIKLRRSYKNYPKPLRKVVSYDPETGKTITLITNHMRWSAQTIADIYKERWQIELFFKAIKQNLRVKSFLGTSKNALLSQLWVALIAYLLLSYLKFKSKFSYSLHTLCSILPVNLFARRFLWEWLNSPFHVPGKSPPEKVQAELVFC